jgi:hypothetical protein
MGWSLKLLKTMKMHRWVEKVFGTPKQRRQAAAAHRQHY